MKAYIEYPGGGKVMLDSKEAPQEHRFITKDRINAMAVEWLNELLGIEED